MTPYWDPIRVQVDRFGALQYTGSKAISILAETPLHALARGSVCVAFVLKVLPKAATPSTTRVLTEKG